MHDYIMWRTAIFTKVLLVLAAPLLLAEGYECTMQQPGQEDAIFNDRKLLPLPSCHWNYKYSIAKSVVSAISFLAAAFVLLLGYRRRRISFFLTASITVSILTYLIVVAEADFSLLINVSISVATGLFASVFTTTTLYCGYFLTGLLAGFTLGFAFLLVFTTFMPLNSVALPCVIIAACGLVLVFVTMWWRHRMLILSSCLVASAGMIGSLDYFVENLFVLQYMEMKIFYGKSAKLCWWSYVIFGLWPLFFIVGMLIQSLLTGRERQKEEYTFVYKIRHRRHRPGDTRVLVRHGSDL